MDAEMWNVVLFNLCEAHWSLRELCAVAAYLDGGKAPAEWEDWIEWRKGKHGFGPGWFEVTMEHVYHHVNYAWNCRHAGAERAIRCSIRDFNRWEKFPKDWPELWPPPERQEGKWPKERWAEHGWRTVRAGAMRPEFEAAEDALGLLVDGVFLRLGDDLDPVRRCPERLREDARAVSEEDFGALVRRFYGHFNAAWNVRRCRKAGGEKRGKELFPREMVRFWPESGRLPRFRGKAERGGRKHKRTKRAWIWKMNGQTNDTHNRRNTMGNNRKKTMAERAMRHGAGLVLRNFTIIDPDGDDNPMSTLNKKFRDGSELVWEMAMPICEIVRLCRAEGIDPDGKGQLAFTKAPIRVAEVGSRLAGDDDVGCGWYDYAVCDFPGLDVEETDLEALELPDEVAGDDGASEEGFGEDDWEE